MDSEGKRIKHRRLPCDLSTIAGFFEPYRNELDTIAVESTFNWYWLVDGLQDKNYKLALANPAAIKQYDGIKHSDDASDAYFLADLLRLGILPTGHIYERSSRSVRDLLRRRMMIVQLRTSLILSFKSLNERTLGEKVSQSLVKKMKPEEARKRFTEPADRLISGHRIVSDQGTGKCDQTTRKPRAFGDRKMGDLSATAKHAGDRKDSGADHCAGDRGCHSVRQGREFCQLQPLRGQSANQQWKKEGRKQSQMRQPISCMGLCGGSSFLMPLG